MNKIRLVHNRSNLKEIEKRFFIGLDLGWKEKRTTGICVLGSNRPSLSLAKPVYPNIVLIEDIFGKDILKTTNPYLKKTEVIAIDAPLTQGRGKGGMRLYEKFLSTKIFRKEKTNPLPPALISRLSDFAREIVKKLEKKGFVLGLNLVETFPTLVKKICGPNLNRFLAGSDSAKTENQRAALICAKVAFWHYQFQTRWLGYKDGFLFLPEMTLWKKVWRQKFYQAWRERDQLKYRHLSTNIFQK